MTYKPFYRFEKPQAYIHMVPPFVNMKTHEIETLQNWCPKWFHLHFLLDESKQSVV